MYTNTNICTRSAFQSSTENSQKLATGGLGFEAANNFQSRRARYFTRTCLFFLLSLFCFFFFFSFYGSFPLDTLRYKRSSSHLSPPYTRAPAPVSPSDRFSCRFVTVSRSLIRARFRKSKKSAADRVLRRRPLVDAFSPISAENGTIERTRATRLIDA